MDLTQRILPSLEQIQKTKDSISSDLDPNAVLLVLRLLKVADLMRSNIYGKMQQKFELSEGRFLLLLCLKDANSSVPITKLATELGVSNATTSIMIKRMLKEEKPLIKREQSGIEKNSYLISLTQKGSELLDMVLPDHFLNIKEKVTNLTAEEQLILLTLLNKIIK